MTRLVVLVLVWSIVPGSAEALENAAHWLREGHLAHQQSQTDDHSDPGPEHGCTGTFHMCPCHGNAAAKEPANHRQARVADQISPLTIGLLVPALSGFPYGIYHPPRS